MCFQPIDRLSVSLSNVLHFSVSSSLKLCCRISVGFVAAIVYVDGV